MWKTIIVTTLLPLAAFAQNSSRNPDVKMKSFKIHYEKDMVSYGDNRWVDNNKSKNKTTIYGPGDWQFGRDTCMAKDRNCCNTTGITNWDRGFITAGKITLSSPEFPDFKADKLIFDDKTYRVKLTGNIRLKDKGTEKYLGEVAYLDFTDDIYKITGLK